jgi:hypothetical protein
VDAINTKVSNMDRKLYEMNTEQSLQKLELDHLIKRASEASARVREMEPDSEMKRDMERVEKEMAIDRVSARSGFPPQEPWTGPALPITKVRPSTAGKSVSSSHMISLASALALSRI